MLEVRLLGSFEIKYKQKLIGIASRPAQSLFAYLILSAGTSHRREKLAGMLWPDSLEETARDNLRHALWRVRKALPKNAKVEFILADDLSIAFNATAEYRLDASTLEKVDENASADELIGILSEYQGELLPGFYDEWVLLEREHLNSVFEHIMARLMALLEEEKRWLEILDWGERWIKLGQKPEPAYRALMKAHGAKGDMSRVAAVYERCVRSLKEIGIEPSEQSKELYKNLKSGKETSEIVPGSVSKESRRESPKTNLPVPITSFIGREKEIQEVVELVRMHRLVTLTGAGGAGKTRLAIQSSNKLLSTFKDGVFWIELAPLADETLVPQAIAKALEVHEVPNQSLNETLSNFLRSKQSLLVMDNCEHLIAECAYLADLLLGACPNLKILTTSREALGLTSEEEWSVPILSLPDPQHISLSDLLMQYEGIRLFVERANAARSGFTLTDGNALSVAQVCRRLDGMPLAIELAAARVRMMSVSEISKHLDQRFDLLTTGSRTALPRHQTLRAAIDWSYDLLSEPERIFFNRLSVFAGGFTLEAAEEVAVGGAISKSEVIDLLGQLIYKSLVTVKAGSEDSESETRYEMLETIREYAREKLDESGETEQLRQRHRDYFIALAEQAEPKLKGGEQFEWLDRLEAEHDNLRAAWNCAIESDTEAALRLASALLEFWFMRGNPREGRVWLSKLLALTSQEEHTARHGHILAIAGRIALDQQDFGASRELLEQALALARISGDKKQIAFALQWLGLTLALNDYDDPLAQVFIEECLAISQELQDQWGIALTIFNLGFLAMNKGHYEEAEESCMKSLAKFQELGDSINVVYVLNLLGELARIQGNYEQAGRYFEENIKTRQKQRSLVGLAAPTCNLAWVALNEGDHRKAKALFEESMGLFDEYGNKNGVIISLSGFAGLLGMAGKREQAARLSGAVESLLGDLRISMHSADQKEFDHYVAVVRGQLDKATFERAWTEGSEMTIEQAIEFALKETKQ